MKLLAALFLLLPVCAAAQKTSQSSLQPAAHGLMMVRATVAGHEGRFLFDSGGGVSTVTPAFAQVIGCHPWGGITGFRMTGDRLTMQRCDGVTTVVAGRQAPAQTVGVLDLEKLLPPDFPKVDGTIALDALAGQPFTLSVGGEFLRVLDAESLRKATAGLHPMPVQVVRDAQGFALTVDLPVQSARGTTWFEADSGNTSGTVVVASYLAGLLGLAATNGAQTVHLRLADGSTFTGAARVRDLVLDGNLGASFLARFDLTVDLPHRKAWLRTRALGNKAAAQP